MEGDTPLCAENTRNQYRFGLRLFGKLFFSITLCSLVLVWAVTLISDYAEIRMSMISDHHRQELSAYGKQAEVLLRENNPEKLKAWANRVMEQEKTWLAILHLNPQWLTGNLALPTYIDGLIIGRPIDYPIHLYHSENPVMEIALHDGDYKLLIQLPQRMRPGGYWQLLHTAIGLGLPILLVALLSYLIYRHIIAPIKVLQVATQHFSEGLYDTRALPALKHRRDEISDLASSFDQMTDRISSLVLSQRQLIQDISHELRTPITRMKLALSDPGNDQFLCRIEQEIEAIQTLVDDTLTLSWLKNENPVLNQEKVDLCLLLDAIADDARFEFPDKQLHLQIPDSLTLEKSNHRALGQAIENIIRNAMKYTPEQAATTVCLTVEGHVAKLEIKDQGPGVKDKYLKDIFKPFFRTENARGRDSGGYGLGLALAQRQIQAVGGSISASNCHPNGLCVTTLLPLDHNGRPSQ